MNISLFLRNKSRKNALYFFCIFSVLFFYCAAGFAQQAVCGSDQQLANQIADNPDIQNQIDWFNNYAKSYVYRQTRGNSGVYVIPVVFQIFHEDGPENISDEQIKSQIAVLNRDYQRLNADTVNLNPIFNGYGANIHVEFRLATIDPFGNCTNGIVRYYTPLTENADDDIKALSVWPAQDYLNIWVVESIRSVGAELQPGQFIAGYAQFPFIGSGRSFSDGVIIRSDFIGNTGTSDSITKLGRVATHEIGHWLGLYHPFQDSCFGGDDVEDTPPVASPNFGCSPRNSCHNDVPDLPDMIENFMDYANGSCQNIFTNGQRTRIDATLSSLRTYVYSPDNLAATGTEDGAAPSNCAPIAAFNATVTTDCAGGTVSFYNYSYNAPVTGWNWSFPGGTPSSSTSQTPPPVSYPNAGNYDVTLTATNANGSNTATKSSYIQVAPATAQLNGITQNMEGTDFPYNWTLGGTSAQTWVRTTQASYSGSACMMFNNTADEVASKIDFIAPNINLAASPAKNLSFEMAYTPRVVNGSPTNDALRIYLSTNCGKNWVPVWSQTGTTLNTLNGVVSDPYFTTYYAVLQSDWRLVNVDLSSYASETNVMIKFEFVSEGGQNIFIDDINAGGLATGIITPAKSYAALDVFPNPVGESATLTYTVNGNANVQISLFDVTGRQVLQLLDGQVPPGSHQLNLNKRQLSTLAQGTYFVELKTAEQVITKKVIIL